MTERVRVVARERARTVRKRWFVATAFSGPAWLGAILADLGDVEFLLQITTFVCAFSAFYWLGRSHGQEGAICDNHDKISMPARESGPSEPASNKENVDEHHAN